jgi:catechol 2,3-dioxygenase-like lactoylglutathione lyase family enzyme
MVMAGRAPLAEDRTSPFEFFNASLEAFSRADLSEAVFRLRGGFFGNLYVAPLLLGEEFSPQKIWSPGAEGEPRLAREYVARYGHLWKGRPDAVAFLGEVWGDSLIRAELRSFINLSKNILNARSESELSDLLRERERFLSPERLKRTQSEVLSRVEKANLYLPPSRPQLALIMLASKDPALSRRFYRDLLEIEPVTRSPLAGGYVEFEFEGVHFAIHGQDRAAPTDPYQIGHPPASFGWGAIFVFRVHDLDRYFQNAAAGRLDVVDSDLSTAGRRYFVVKDPSGYLVEITEEDPKGLEPV